MAAASALEPESELVIPMFSSFVLAVSCQRSHSDVPDSQRHGDLETMPMQDLAETVLRDPAELIEDCSARSNVRSSGSAVRPTRLEAILRHRSRSAPRGRSGRWARQDAYVPEGGRRTRTGHMSASSRPQSPDSVA